MSDDALLASLLAAVDATPNDVPLRLHVADLLASRDRLPEALTHCTQALSRAPSDPQAVAMLQRLTTAIARPVEPQFDWGRAEEQIGPVAEPEFAQEYRPDAVTEDVERPSLRLADVLDMYTGSSERNLTQIFAAARRNAPCVLFFDEVDALGRKRSHLANASSMRNTVNTLLAEMDSLGGVDDGVFVLGATNHPWDIDTALRRPGRFDRMLLVLPPDAPARAAILRHHLRDRPLAGIDLDALARSTEHFSGADLAQRL